MIQFNLLPDVKLQYLKVRRTQHLVITASFLAIAISVFVLVVLIGTVDVFQKKNMHDLNKDISTDSTQLENTPNLSKMLTVQDQLLSLTQLHNQKPVASRLFQYIKQVTPSTAAISNLSVDFGQHTMTITGTASSLDVVNTYVDTLKFTTYSAQGSNTSPHAFSNVVLSQFTRSDTGASFTITAAFDKTIFDNADNVNLTVPNIITTRSNTQSTAASDLFKTGSQ